jgi:hypothetical protein
LPAESVEFQPFSTDSQLPPPSNFCRLIPIFWKTPLGVVTVPLKFGAFNFIEIVLGPEPPVTVTFIKSEFPFVRSPCGAKA